MRKRFYFMILALVALSFNVATAGGGPDAYGYTWLDSNDPSGPTYSWIDITGNGTQMTGFADDNAVGPIALGFDFHYYWNDYDELKVGSNGWMAFKTSVGNIAHCFPTIPTPGGNADNFLAPFMTDINLAGASNPGEVWFWSNGVDSFVISYINVPWWRQGNPDYIGSNTFQVVLSGVDSSITFQYGTTDQLNFNDTPGCAADIEIGIENVTGNIGLEVYNETIPQSNLAVKFYYPASVTLQIQDVTPLWNANTDNQGQFFLVGNNIDLTAGIANVGNVSAANATNVSVTVRDLPLNTVYTSSTTVAAGQTAGNIQTVTFSPSWNLATAGQYYYEVSTNNSGDINPSNNDNTVEISAVEVDGQCNIPLSYASQNPPDGVIAWSGGGGGDGVGVKIVPPGYPVTLQSVDMFIRQAAFNPANNSAYVVEIWDDSGPNGTPGTMLTSENVAMGSYTPETWVNTTLSSVQTISSGAFYVAWIMGGDSIGIGTEQFGPISQRSFEILSSAWATYRQNTVEEFLITANVDGCTIGVEDEFAQGILSMKNFPNPTNGKETLRFEIPTSSVTKVSVMNIMGQVVYARELGTLAKGIHEFTFDTEVLNSGVYFIQLEANQDKLSSKMVVTK